MLMTSWGNRATRAIREDKQMKNEPQKRETINVDLNEIFICIYIRFGD